jgi:predicted aspartyl protease
VVARCHAASGGARWEAIGAIETTATLTVGGMTGTARSLEDVRTGRFRAASTVGGMATAEGFDGSVAWQQTVGGEIAVRDAPAAVQLARTQCWLTARGYFRAGGARYRELGDRTLGARGARAIEATPDGGAPVELWFDAATGLLVRTIYQDGGEPVATTFDDFRDVDGVRLPFRTLIDSGDPRNLVTMTATTVRVRPDAPDDAYQRPRTDVERLRFAGGATRSLLPFDRISNHIYIHARIDGQPVRLIVDTGGLNLLTPAAAARLGLTSIGKIAGGGAGDHKVDVGMARGRELAVGDVRLADPVFYVYDLSLLADADGEPFDGLVGFELFQRLAVRIDYGRTTLTLMQRDALVPPPGAIAVPIVLRDRTPIAQGSIDGIPARFTLDTGAGNSITVHAPFAREHGLDARYRPKFEAVVGLGAGGPIRAKPVRIEQIKLGGAAVSELVGELYVGDKGAFADPEVSANLGAGVLSRFVVTFDYQGRTMYLEPAAGTPRDIYDRAGMAFRAAGDALRITAITPGGPAERARLTTEDRIVAIDGAAVTSRPLWAWRDRLTRGEIGARHVLTVERAAARRDVALVLVEQLP